MEKEISKFSAPGAPLSNVAEKLKLLRFKVYEKKLQDLWRVAEEYSLEPILIKGWAAAMNYPQPYSRRIGDFDLAVAPADWQRARAVSGRLELDEIDWHAGLRHLDTAVWNDLLNNAVSIKCGETDLRILRPEDHLRVLCVHWLNDGGREKEKLWDIYYAVSNRPPDFDWARCLETISAKRRKWIACAVGLAHQYLGLPIDDTPLASAARNLPDWLTNAVEREWNSPVAYKYLQTCLSDRREFYAQLKKRLPPNPIQATIEMDGDFDDKTRVFYQIGNVFKRFAPSVRRISRLLDGQSSNADRQL